MEQRGLEDLRPGERVLVTRKYGGLGDILISSMLFPLLAEQYPEIRVDYALPRQYHELFAGAGLKTLAYEQIRGPEPDRRRASVLPAVAKHYALIEDISLPCHVWENFFVPYGGTDNGGNGLKWRNRLDMWGRWMGLRIVRPRTNIVLTEPERVQARRILQRAAPGGGPVCLLAPFSANRTKNYPWYGELAAGLCAEGFRVVLLHNTPVRGTVPTLDRLSLRVMGSVCAVADLIVSVDSAAFHWGGILGRRTLGIFNVNDGAAYCRYYPTARPVQTCATPCLNTKYPACLKQTEPDRLVPGTKITLSRCYPRSTVDAILEAVRG